MEINVTGITGWVEKSYQEPSSMNGPEASSMLNPDAVMFV